MTNATEANSSKAVTLPKFTAAQIEKDCPAQLQDLAKELRQGLEKLCEQKKLAGDQEIAVKQLIAQAKKLCDAGGFNAFQKMFFPDLGKSRVYELLAIGTNKKSAVEIRASTRGRQAKFRANKAAAPVSVTVTEKSEPGPKALAAPRVDGAVQATSTAMERPPELAKPPGAVTPNDIVSGFTSHVMELKRRISKHKVERFLATAVPADVLAEIGKFLNDLAIRKKSEAIKPAPAVVLTCDGAVTAEQSAGGMEAKPPARDDMGLDPSVTDPLDARVAALLPK